MVFVWYGGSALFVNTASMLMEMKVYVNVVALRWVNTASMLMEMKVYVNVVALKLDSYGDCLVYY